MIAYLLLCSQLYQLQAVDREQPLIDEADGLSVRVRWATIEPKAGEYDFSWIDRQRQRAKDAWMVWRLRVMAGWSSPSHSYRYSVTDRSRGQVLTLPVPWSAHHIRAHHRLQRALAGRYADDPDLKHVDVPGFWRSAEMHIPAAIKQHKRFTNERMAHAYKVRINVLTKFFKGQTVVLNHSPEGKWGRLVREHAKKKGIGVQMNALKAGTNTRWEGYTLVKGWEGPQGWQMVGPSGNKSRFGGPLSVALEKGWPWDWIEVYRGDVAATRKWLDE